MKKIFILLVSAFFAASCGNSEQTIKNIEKLTENQRNSAADFDKYSQRAARDSMYNLAALFEAIAASKEIQAKNLGATYEKLSSKHITMSEYEAESVDTPTVQNISEIKANMETQLAELGVMIKIAEHDKASKDAIEKLSWTNVSSGKAVNFIGFAIDAIREDTNDSSLFGEWIVCPNCGDLYRQGDLFDNCDICDTPADKFLVFNSMAFVK